VELTEAQLQSFIELYEKKFGTTLNKAEAHKKALILLNYALLCITPLAKSNTNDINNMPNVSDNP